MKKLSLGFILLLFNLSASAQWVELGTVDSGFKYYNTFNLDYADYISEQDIPSDTFSFYLASAQTVYIYADTFNYTLSSGAFREINLLDQSLSQAGVPDTNFITGVGSIDGLGGMAPNFSYFLNPGLYQINYKSYGEEIGYVANRVRGEAVQGLGSVNLGLTIGSPIPSVPEPSTWSLMLVGLLLSLGFKKYVKQ